MWRGSEGVGGDAGEVRCWSGDGGEVWGVFNEYICFSGEVVKTMAERARKR